MKILVKFAAIFLMLSGSVHAFADNNNWNLIESDNEEEWSFKVGSGDFGTLDGKHQVVRVIVKKFNKKTNKSNFVRYFIKKTDCDSGVGALYENDLEGNFISKNSYVQGGNTWGTEIGDALCAFYNSTKNAAPKKAMR